MKDDNIVANEDVVTFQRSDVGSSWACEMCVENCTTGETYWVEDGESVSFTINSSTNYWYISDDNVFNYYIYIGDDSGMSDRYYATYSPMNGSEKIITFGIRDQEYSFGRTYFNANGGSFQKYDGTHSNKVYNAEQKIGNYNGQNVYKGNNGEAYCAWFWGISGKIYPLLVSRTPTSVYFYDDNAGGHTDYLSFTYNGETWYVSNSYLLDIQNYWNDHTDYQAFIGVDQSGYLLHQFDTFDSEGNWQYDEYRLITSEDDLIRYAAEKMLITLDTETSLWEQGFSGGGIQFPDDPYRRFYSFSGWYTARSGGTKVTSSSSKAGHNRTLYAQYSLGWSDVIVDTNCDALGGQWIIDNDGEYASVSSSSSLNYNSFYYVLNDNGVSSVSNLKKTGHTITGISVCDSSRNRGSKVYTLSELQNGISALTLYQDYYNTFGVDPVVAHKMYMIFVWQKNTYTLSVRLGSYNSSSGYTVTLSAPGCSISNSKLTQTNSTSTIYHTYSTTALTITLTRSDAHLQIYVDGSLVSQAEGSTSYRWTPNANRTLTWYLRELSTVRVSSDDNGISGVTFSSSANNPSGCSTVSNATSLTNVRQGTIVDFKANVKSGYIFEGWYNGSTRVSTSASYSGVTISGDLSLTAKATKIYDLIKYDNTGQYHYFEDGHYPQSYVGDSLNSTLNSWYTSQSSTATYVINRQTTYCYTYNGTKYARVYCPKSSTVTLSSGSSKSFYSGTYYWFTVAPIRWRVSDYAVSSDYYSTTLYSRFVNDGCVNGVSEYVLHYGAINDSVVPTLEGWKYVDGGVHTDVRYNNSAANCLSYTTTIKEFDYFNDTGTNKKVLHETISSEGIYQASISDIDSAGITDYRAKATDLVCMLVGIDYGDYCSYSTRDLYNLGCGKSVTADGTVRNLWLNSACGVRFVYASTGKSS